MDYHDAEIIMTAAYEDLDDEYKPRHSLSPLGWIALSTALIDAGCTPEEVHDFTTRWDEEHFDKQFPNKNRENHLGY